MAYVKTNWKDRVVERPNTYTMTDNGNGTVTLTPVPGQIIERGTPLNAENLNKIEDAIVETNTQLSQKANDFDVVKKGYGTLNDFDEDTRRILQGLEHGEINAVLGDGNVFNYNLSPEVKNSFYNKKNIYNILKNTSFFNVENWTTTAAEGNVENGVYIITPTGQYAQVSSELFEVNANDKLYIYAKVKVDDSWGVKLEVVNSTSTVNLYQKNLSTSSDFVTISDIFEVSDASLPIKMRLVDYMPEPVDKFYLTTPMIINLTDIFGSGNEPTKDEFERIILKKQNGLFFSDKIVADDLDLINSGIYAKSMYVNYTLNGDLIVSFKYNKLSDMRITFGRCGVNNLFSFKQFNLFNNGERIVKPISEIDDVNLFLDVNTDFISPYIFGGDIAGDAGDTYYFTGGWHGYNGDSTGTPTARNVDVKVYTDNIYANSNVDCYCDEVKIIVTNRVQAFNTVKVDGSGAEMLEEKLTFTITSGNVEIDAQIKAIGNIMLIQYMGIQVQNHAWDGEIFIDGDETHRSWLPVAYKNIESGNKSQSTCSEFTLRKDGNCIKAYINHGVGLGNLKGLSNTTPLMWTGNYNKSYFNLIKDTGIGLSSGEIVSWRGGYKFYYEE